MGQVTIVIDRREYAIKCGDGEEAHIIKLSRILDEKAKILNQNVGLINENMMLAMVGLLLADELEDLKNQTATPQNNNDSVKINDTAIAENIDSQVNRLNSLIADLRSE